jgi:cytochrome c551/c552
MFRRWFLALPAFCAAFAAPVPGLLGRFSDGASTVTFSASAPHFYLDPAESIHPSLSPRFQGEWQATLQVLAAGPYEFSHPITIANATSPRHTLSAGSHPVRIPVSRSTSAPAQFRLLWKGPGFDWEPVPRAAFTHEPPPPPPSLAGARIVEQAGCANCHQLPTPARPAPSLANIGSRTNPNWLYAFLGRHAAVPLSEPQRATLAAHLAAQQGAPAPKPRRSNEVVIGKGGELFGTMGCVFCHPSGSLTGLGSKYNLNVLTERLLSTHQPSLLLNDDDATALAAHLTRSTNPAFEQPAPAAAPTAGPTLLQSLGCNGCHQPAGNQTAANRPVPRQPDCRLVRTSWSPAEKESVRAFLSAKTNPTPAPVFTLPALLERHHCLACHRPGTEAPELDGAGEKLRSSWLGQVVWGTRRIRHGRELRMPQYREADMRPLVAALAKAEGLAPGEGPPPPPLDDALRLTGIGLFGTNSKKQGMACIGCHDWGANKSLGEEGPQLQNGAERLRFDWYERWMRNPARILSGTSMPSYFSGQSLELARPRILALWAAMEWGARAPVPDGFRVADLEVTSEAKPAPGKHAVIVRWDMPEATPAAIAVGLPGGLSFCFDAGQSKLLYAWRGGFLDMTGTLLRKTDAKRLTPTAALVGDVFWRSPAAYPIALGAERRSPTPRFKGYRLVDGTPEFRYLLDNLEVREILTPHQNALRRRLTFTRVDGPVFFNGRPVPTGANVTVEEILP